MRKLSESIWSNINKRSEGDILRKEDDIDFMDIKSFCEYLKTVYKCRGDRSITYYAFNYADRKESVDTLVVSLYEDRHGYLTYIYYDGIYIGTQLIVLKELKCVDEFNDKFSTKITQCGHEVENVEIFPKDKNTKITNRFFLKVLDFLLDKIEYPLIPDIEKMNNLKESIWSNINKRSEGNLERKEDDVNDLNQDELFDYIKGHYEPMSQYEFDNNHSYKKNDISIPVILPVIASYSYAANLRFEKFGKIVVFGKDIEEECPAVYKLIVDNYMISDFGRFLFCISPKDGSNKIDNKFFIGFLDFLIDNVKDTDKEKLIIKKK